MGVKVSLTSIFPNSIEEDTKYNPNLSRYVIEPGFAFRIKILVALAFVPTEYMSEAFEDMSSKDFYRQHFIILEPLLSYFNSTYVGGSLNRQIGIAPIYPHMKCL
ncbi:hypothetical protein RF11_13979 [Thelohanellus kitauei]|uniref:Uncharacterized protein n=1 Tax=Thelohanellus kitauei TaxID=669202 RepID=A0A0C2M1Q9_THEKT|nr:hypothetical protein RF11_13979 [Thelohanellus kitauei]